MCVCERERERGRERDRDRETARDRDRDRDRQTDRERERDKDRLLERVSARARLCVCKRGGGGGGRERERESGNTISYPLSSFLLCLTHILTLLPTKIKNPQQNCKVAPQLNLHRKSTLATLVISCCFPLLTYYSHSLTADS